MADSFQGGVDSGRGELRARVAVQGANLEALTAGETFRIPLARCSLAREGQKILVRDVQGTLAIWSDDEGFLDALDRVPRGALREQVRRLRGANRRRRGLATIGKLLVAAALVFAVSIPATRWAVRGGVPALSDRIGRSALEKLALPTGVAPEVEQQLGAVAVQLRPVSSLSRPFRVLLADYADVYSFGLPPDAVVVTAGLVCAADDPALLTAAVARELAHLERRDVCQRVAEAAEWRTPIDLARGDTSLLRERMLDFADPRRTPGFTPEQDTAAEERALAMLVRAGGPLASRHDLATLMDRLKQLHLDTAEPGSPHPAEGKDGSIDWPKVRAEACSLIGR